MPDCPRCNQKYDARAIACPHCQLPLKAYGHPGIPLHRSPDGEYLCASCLYHEDDTCNFPKRPYAKDCTLYRNVCELTLPPPTPYISGGWLQRIKNWCQQNILLLVILCLVIVSFVLSMS
jgi:hypothetical protein